MNNKLKEFCENLYSLSYVDRYAGVPRVKNESVAEHSFYVASLVIELDKYYKFDVGKATVMAVAHDWPESKTGDITILVKRTYPDISSAVDQASIVEIESYPPWLYRYMHELIAANSVEALIVHMADIISCAQYSAHEIKLGNTGFMSGVYDESMTRLIAIEDRLYDYKR